MKTINNIFKKYLKDNLFRIILLLMFFVLGIIFSVIYLQFLDEDTKNILINYMQQFNVNILNGDYTVSIINISYNVIKYSLIYTLIIILLGCSAILSKLIYIVFTYKGFTIGFSLSVAIMLLGNIKGSLYGIIFLFLPNIVFIFFEIVISIIWLKFSNNILKDRNLYNIRKQIYEKVMISIVTSSIMTIVLIPIQILINYNIVSFLKIL